MTPRSNGESKRRAGECLVAGILLASGATGAYGQAAPAASAAAGASAPQRFDVNEFIVRGNTTLPSLEIETAVYPFEGPGRSLEDVNAARDALQKVYQNRGFQSVVVELPQQQVKDGVIVLQVVEARVGRLRVEGAKYDSPQNIRDAVPALAEGKVPDFTEAQQQLTDLNKSPDLQVVPALKPGVLPQTVDVDLKVDDHNPWHGSLEVNNDNSPNTTPLRTTVSLSNSNLWQLGQVLSGSYVVAPQNRSDAEVYSLSYLAPLKDTHWSLLATMFHSNSNVASLGSTDVLGKGTAYGLTAIYALPSTESYTQSASLEIDHKHFDENDTIAGTTTQSPLTYVPLTLSYSGQLTGKTSQTTFALSMTTDIRGLGSDPNAFDNKRYQATADFIYGKFDFNHTEDLPHDIQVNAHLSAQLANSPLVSSEQFSAGGMNSVRGYQQAEDTGDSGVIGSFELRSPSLAKYVSSDIDEWRFHVFTDMAHLWLLSPLPEQNSSFNLMSVGFGTSLTLMKFASADFEAGWPLRDGSVSTKAYSPRFDFYMKVGF